MKTVVLSLIIMAQAIHAQAPKKVTVTGCIYQGVECLTLKDSKGKQDYSIAGSDKLKVGQAYTITGTVAEIGFCQEGKPMLAPTQIKDAKLKCDLKSK